jgi:hypothetical protein
MCRGYMENVRDRVILASKEGGFRLYSISRCTVFHTD